MILFFCSVLLLKAQDNSNYRRSNMFYIMDIAPEARAAGMGDVGVATSPDVMSQKWNASKYIFAEPRGGIALSYTPWLSKIAKGLNIEYLSGYFRFAEKSAIGFSANYLSIGEINLTDMFGTDMGTISSANQYTIDASYSHRLGENLSGGITLRYASTYMVESTGTPNGGVLRSSPAFTGDVSFFYTKPLTAFGKDNNLAIGTSISNLGTKVKMSNDDEALMPMNWRLGASWEMNIDTRNIVTASFDVVKSLVPLNYTSDITVFEAIGKSFDKSRDLVCAFGLEYSFMKTAMLRTGYHNSRNIKGFRYFTLGAGLMYRSINFDVSYLISASSLNTSISNTFRLTLSYVWNR
ncbi:MAG: type IX secretion system outer membrane channel protein PorV [Prevotellaceae bacterium]|nr:type IX secretion system outer membrane channel protein PorV [Prevotellaceae bacterium]